MSRAAERLAARAGNVWVHLDGVVYELQHVDSWALSLVGHAELEGSALYQRALADAAESRRHEAAAATVASEEDLEKVAAQHARVAQQVVQDRLAAAVAAPGGAAALRRRMDAYVMASVVGMGFVRDDVPPLGKLGKTTVLLASWRPEDHLDNLAGPDDPPLYIDPVRLVADLPEGPGTRAEKLAALSAQGKAWLHSLTPETVATLWQAAQTLSRGVQVASLRPFRRGA